MSVYKFVEARGNQSHLLGEDAARRVVAEAGRSLDELRIARVVKQDLVVAKGKTAFGSQDESFISKCLTESEDEGRRGHVRLQIRRSWWEQVPPPGRLPRGAVVAEAAGISWES
ncbi:MAG: dodecin domain-containing protein [Desulfobacterales bacterium]|nr:dodecin domain-containing protein [Desulfobacterales bacterium]